MHLRRRSAQSGAPYGGSDDLGKSRFQSGANQLQRFVHGILNRVFDIGLQGRA